jgi:hypothetical protein
MDKSFSKDAGLLGCKALSLGEWFLTFQKIIFRVKLLDHEDEGTAVFQDVANHSPSDTALCPS